MLAPDVSNLANFKELEPFPRLETKSLYLEELGVPHLEGILATLSNPEVMRYHDLPRATTRAEGLRFIAEMQLRRRQRQGVRWGMIAKEGQGMTAGAYLGGIGLNHLNAAHKKASVGYEQRVEFWGRGLMTEALLEVCGFAFERLGLKRLEASVFPENARSLELLCRCRFVKEGTLRSFARVGGQRRDVTVLSRLPTDC